MIFDKQLMLAEEMSLVSETGTVDSTNIIDLGSSYTGPGEPLTMFAKLDDAVTSDGSATVQFEVITDNSSSFDSAAVTLMDSGALALTSLTADAVIFKQALPLDVKRYLKITATVATAATTAGSLTAGLVLDVQSAS